MQVTTTQTNNTMKTNYQQQATDLLKELKAKMTITLSNTKPCPWNDSRLGLNNHYKVTLKSQQGSYTFDFYGSINDRKTGAHPSEYDVLACLQYYTHESFDDFCSEYGYEVDSIKALKTHKACLVQSRKLQKLFTQDEIQKLEEVR